MYIMLNYKYRSRSVASHMSHLTAGATVPLIVRPTTPLHSIAWHDLASSLGATFILNATSMRLVFVYMDGWLGLTGKLTPIVRSAPAQPTLTDEPLGGGMSLKNIAHSANFSSS